jgi:hypothetical protein
VTFPVDHPLLERAAQILRENRFAVEDRVLDGLDQPVLIVESPYVLAVLVAGEHWHDVAGTVDDAEVALVNWASEVDRSSRRWDLYVVVLLERWPTNAQDGANIERAEANTDLSRKVVRSGIRTDDTDRVRDALRPLLPYAPRGHAVLPDVSVALEERLRVHGIDAETAERAVRGFLQGGEVWL